MRMQWIIILLTAWLSSTGGNPIPWSEQPLTWKDFKGKPRATGLEAETHCQIDAFYETDREGVTLHITCHFLPQDSWTKSRDSEVLLRHEQYHFHLTEVYTRQLRHRLVTAAREGERMDRVFQRIFREVHEELHTSQQAYDRETRHSLNRDAQQRWERQIDDWLAEWDSWRATEWRIPFRH